ncbi:hypothetical protein ACIQVK_20175 [Streptomyces sp. NPDC090493]|uniref:hypothetical protein n=1 Tax=Streptomyces sp. NPDC090493 TaxID=3365964 RepID=UPI00381319ED
MRAIQRRGDRLKRIQEHRPAIYAARQQLALFVPAWVAHWLERGGSPVPDRSVGAVTSLR